MIDFKDTIRCAAILAPLLGGCKSTDPHSDLSGLHFGYNAIELGSEEQSSRVRAINDVEFKLQDTVLTYHGFNDLDRGDNFWHFGANVIGVKGSDWPVEIVAKTVTTEAGFDHQTFGVRSELPAAMLDGFGYVELTSNAEALDARVFYGRSLESIWSALPEDISVSIFHSGRYFYDGESSNYLELQINKSFGKSAIFARIEAADYDIQNGALLLGVSVSL